MKVNQKDSYISKSLRLNQLLSLFIQPDGKVIHVVEDMNLGVTIIVLRIDKDGQELLALGGLDAAIPIVAIRMLSSKGSKEPPAVLNRTSDVVSKQTQVASLLEDYDFALQ